MSVTFLTNEDKELINREIADKVTLENGVLKFWKSGETDTELFSVDISSIGGTIGFNNYNYNPNYSNDSVAKPTHPNANGHYVIGRTIAKALQEMYVMTLSN